MPRRNAPDPVAQAIGARIRELRAEQGLTSEKLAWAVRKDDARLAARLNDALQLLKRNGTIAYIFNRWIPVTVEVH